MANVLIGDKIWSDVGVLYTPTFAGGSWGAGNPLTNLADRALWKVARSSAATEIATRFEVDLKADRATRILCIPKHTLSSGAKWRAVGRKSTTLFQYVAGEDLVARGATFTRSSTATYVDRAGMLRTAASGVPRDGHWVNGARAYLHEDVGTNLCIRSEEFDTWTNTTTTVTANAIAAPDGATTADLLTPTGGTGSNRRRTITFTGDGEKCFAFYLKAGTSSRSLIGIFDSTASVARHYVRVTWTAGVPTLSLLTGGGTIYPVEVLANGWYRCLASATGIIAANAHTLVVQADDLLGTGTVYAWGAQAENAIVPSSYIPTAAATVSRVADSLYFPYTAVPQAMTVYLRSRNVGAYISQTSAARILHIGDAVATTDSRITLIRTTGATNVQVLYDNGPTQVTASPAPSPTPALGNLIEHRGVLLSDWSVTCGVSVSGGTEVTASSAAGGSSTAWANTRIYFAGHSDANNTAITHAVVGTGSKTLAESRLLTYDSGWLNAWPTAWDAETAEGLNLPLLHVLSEDYSARYWSLQISDPDNADGYVDLHRLAICGAYEPSVNFTTGAEFAHESDTTTEYTRGGGGIHDVRPLRRVTRFTIANIEDAEAIGSVIRRARQQGARKQCVIVLRPDATADLMPETSFLAVPREQTRIEYPYAIYRNAAFAFTEEL